MYVYICVYVFACMPFFHDSALVSKSMYFRADGPADGEVWEEAPGGP